MIEILVGGVLVTQWVALLRADRCSLWNKIKATVRRA